jgi:hypothetical protein
VSSLASFVFAAILLPFVLLCFYARPASDDFSYAVSVLKYGFWDAQTYWYTQWSGRFFSTLLVTLFCRPSVMSAAYPIGPFLVMVLLFVGLLVLTRAVFPSGSGNRQTLAVALGIFAVFATQMPSTAEGFYWVTGAFSNEIGSALFLILLGLIISACRAGATVSKATYAFVGLLAIAVGGSTETVLLVAFLVVAFGTAAQVIFRRPCWKIWGAALLVLVLAGTVSVIAPGNFVRASTIHFNPSVLFAGAHSVKSLLEFLAAWILSPALLAATVFISASFHPHRDILRSAFSRYGKKLLLLPVLWLGLLAAAFFPAFWATGVLPPGRAMDSIYLFFLLGWFPSVLLIVEAWDGWRLPGLVSEHLGSALALLILLVCFAVTNNFRRAVSDLTSSARLYAMQLDRRTEYLQHARGTSVLVPTLYSLPGSIAFDDVTYDPTHWRNVAVAEFYGLSSIRRVRPEGQR